MEIITGKVLEGKKLGRKLGFETINLDYSGKLEGVFRGRVKSKGEFFDAAIHIGKNLDGSKLEAHIFKFNGGIVYGDSVEIEILEKVSENEVFNNQESLKRKIARDIEKIKKLL